MELEKTIIRAGVAGRVEQFALRVGDVVNPLMRPAGVLIPEGAGRRSLQAGFGQTEAQVTLPPGRHTLQLLLGDANHVPHDPPVMSAPITVTVSKDGKQS